MGMIALASAKGSPGVSTLAVALAGVYPLPALVADLDPAGSDLALRFRDAQGQALDAHRGLLSLGAAVRRGGTSVHEHLQVISGGLEVLVGVPAPEQVAGLGPVWPHLAFALQEVPGRHVIADCGRVTAGSPTVPVLLEANAVVLVARSTVEGLAHLRERLRSLIVTARGGRRGPVPLGVIVVAGERDRSVAGDVQRLIDSAGLRARVLGAVADDPKGAAVLEGRVRGAVGRTPLVRSVRSLVPALMELAELADLSTLAEFGAFEDRSEQNQNGARPLGETVGG